jgi:hypothetical protein
MGRTASLGSNGRGQSRSPSLFHSSHFDWEPAEGLEMFRYVSIILSSLPAEFNLLTYGFGKAALHSASAKACFISTEVSSQLLVVVRAEQTH